MQYLLTLRRHLIRYISSHSSRYTIGPVPGFANSQPWLSRGPGRLYIPRYAATHLTLSHDDSPYSILAVLLWLSFVGAETFHIPLVRKHDPDSVEEWGLAADTLRIKYDYPTPRPQNARAAPPLRSSIRPVPATPCKSPSALTKIYSGRPGDCGSLTGRAINWRLHKCVSSSPDARAIHMGWKKSSVVFSPWVVRTRPYSQAMSSFFHWLAVLGGRPTGSSTCQACTRFALVLYLTLSLTHVPQSRGIAADKNNATLPSRETAINSHWYAAYWRPCGCRFSDLCPCSQLPSAEP